MRWEQPPISKIYEALGAVADGRVEISGNTAKVWSSSRNKAYDISYDSDRNAIMANDNASYWKGYLGYPSIAYLLTTQVLPYEQRFGELLAGIAWKDINVQFKNDFDAALEHILSSLDRGDREDLKTYVDYIEQQIIGLKLEILGSKKKPPSGY